MIKLSQYLHISNEILENLILSLAIFLLLSFCRILANLIIKRKIPEVKNAYYQRRVVIYIYTLLMTLLIGRVWIKGITTFLGLISAGLAIAMHDTIANITAWAFIISRQPFKVGDRIQIGDTAGDVIDIRLLQFSMIEVGNWVDADQSTGRIIHVPNNKILREPLANYVIGFEYIWHEIPVLITFESNWKKAKEKLADIAAIKAEHLSADARKQVRRAANKYLIIYKNLTPIVYTTVKDSGVLLTLRYLVNPRQRRTTEQEIWEAILDAFSNADDIELAYPTTRIYYNPQKNISG